MMDVFDVVEVRFPIPDKLHKALKQRALDEEKSLKGLIIELLEKAVTSDA